MTTQENTVESGTAEGVATEAVAGEGVATEAVAGEGVATEAVAAEAVMAAVASFPVAPGYRVNVRSGPSSSTELVRQLPYGARIAIRCQRKGERVSGPYGTTDIWDNIAPGQYVSDAYVKTGSDGMIATPCGS
ncbi:SH3 domain-containing protein [Streptomyces sp. MST-110588]|uniref:SH3 domain-containing protein n=1 Tax=Streptomyces sp. MST-110588 TaxID=2833628 RepID=UPI001F5C8408|nr:SH3 domain-containing protein [Streptomyces sp. MST-110588]UNO40577.1 SH3 domain-containing protein [Streptomyces sp. MST-110588]